MTVLTAPVEEGVREYLSQPVNFGSESGQQRVAEADAFRAGAEWAAAHVDGRVLLGLVPGLVEARMVRVGDRVRVVHGDATVITMRRHGRPGVVYIGTRTDGGAEVTHEFRTSERVRVLAGA